MTNLSPQVHHALHTCGPLICAPIGGRMARRILAAILECSGNPCLAKLGRDLRAFDDAQTRTRTLDELWLEILLLRQAAPVR